MSNDALRTTIVKQSDLSLTPTAGTESDFEQQLNDNDLNTSDWDLHNFFSGEHRSVLGNNRQLFMCECVCQQNVVTMTFGN